MKKNKALSYYLLSASLSFSYIYLNSNKSFSFMSINNNLYEEEYDGVIIYEKEPVEDLLLELNKDIENYEKTKEEKYLDIAITNLGNIPKKAEYINVKDEILFNKINYIFNKIKIYCYNLKDNKSKEIYVQKLAESVLLGWKYNKNITYYKDIFLLKELVEYNKNILVNIQERLDYLKYVAFVLEVSGDEHPKNDMIPDILPPVEDDADHEYEDFPKEDIIEDFDNVNKGESITPPDLNNGGNNNGNNNIFDNNLIESGSNFEDIHNSTNSSSIVNKYKKENNNCYKVRETYIGGKLVKEEKEMVPKTEYVKCGIYDYFDFGNNVVMPSVEVDDEHLYNNQNEDSNEYVYYTVSKNNKNPYYFNTGIRVDKYNKSLTYNQVIDVFYQIAVKQEDFNIKDNDKSLFVIEGIPIVFNSIIDVYSEQYINSILSVFNNIGIKIMDSDSHDTLVNKFDSDMNKDYIPTILINEVELTEHNVAWIESDSIKTSINKILLSLNIEISNLKNSIVISKNGIEIELFNNSKDYYINGEKKQFNSKVYIMDNNYIVELQPILDAFNYEMDYNMEQNILIIKSKK